MFEFEAFKLFKAMLKILYDDSCLFHVVGGATMY